LDAGQDDNIISIKELKRKGIAICTEKAALA
jgi:hypothetical protein